MTNIIQYKRKCGSEMNQEYLFTLHKELKDGNYGMHPEVVGVLDEHILLVTAPYCSKVKAALKDRELVPLN